ncbi:hypothetical protein AMJ87_12995 [candidate division WOR_3 bacterium SM23_60]|uniref:Fibronectin type-III domain-containing protein n=1 Tax=candidate division WOR_3 bacterium SM23_60 TaxID=1703780 RepID=A0A0S8G3Y3_UNCW3|nr:MAG: hypothetical protein AMJ87_12995 [candidate division WOR_3 bacterium SM23_60]
MGHGGVSDTVNARVNPPFADGWPQSTYAFIKASPAFGDIDTAYPGLEIVAGDNKGNIWAWHYDGTPVVGDGRIFHFGYQFTYPEELWSTAAIGDINDDGLLEIVFGARRDTSNLYCIDGNGTVLPGWPQTVPGRIIGSTALADIDEDGDLEIFVLSENYGDIYAFHHDGTGVYAPNGLLYDLPGKCYSTPAIGDIDCDGDLEIVSLGGGTSDSLYVWDRNGNILEDFFPVHIPDSNLVYDVVLADIVGDERLEILFCQFVHNKLYVLDAQGNTVWIRDLPYVAGLPSYPVTADINGDGRPEVLCNDQKGFFVFDSLGNDVVPFPDTTFDSGLSIVANVDDNPGMDIMVMWSDCWRLRCISYDNQPVPGFPLQYGHSFIGSPAVYDIDADGKLELMVATYDELFYVYDLEASQWDYPKFRFDPYNTGTYDRRQPSAPYISTAQKIGQDVRFTWNTITTDEYGAPELMHGYVVYRSTSPDFEAVHTDSIGIVLQPDTTYRDVGVLNGSASYYYCVRAVDWARNKSERSNVAYAFRKQFNENTSTTD